jgi:hypothetical protein
MHISTWQQRYSFHVALSYWGKNTVVIIHSGPLDWSQKLNDFTKEMTFNGSNSDKEKILQKKK